MQCFGTITNKEYYAQTSLDSDWRTWTFQVCTQWGFFMVRGLAVLPLSFLLTPHPQTPPPDPARPRIISNLLTVD